MSDRLRVADLQLDELGRVILPAESGFGDAPRVALPEDFCVSNEPCPYTPPPQPPANPDCGCPPPTNTQCACPEPSDTNPDCQNV